MNYLSNKIIVKDLHFFNTHFKKLILRYTKNTPTKLKKAIFYSLFPGGKRIRPLLIFATGEMLNIKKSQLFHLSAAIEVVHNYSLIHDDLPSMDNDDYRRGKLTVHKKFDEATAILAGDSLLTLAFEILTELPVSSEKKVQIIKLVSNYIGSEGLIKGQVLDLDNVELKKIDKNKLKKTIYEIYNNKTGKLFQLCVYLPGLVKGVNKEKMEILYEIGHNLGLLFQLTDDLIDFNSGQDKNKLTYPSGFGLEKSKTFLDELYSNTKFTIIENFPEKKSIYLLYLIKKITNRKE